MAKLGKVTTTDRGFQVIEFQDHNEMKCSLQQSSLALYDQPGVSAVWLGCSDDPSPRLSRMHLTDKQVKALVRVLRKWLRTGKFEQ